MRTLHITFFILSGLISNQVAAVGQFQSHHSIIDTAKQFLADTIEVTENIEVETRISRLDPRLKLSQCQQPLQAFTNSDIRQNDRFSIGIRCEGIKPWSLYVNVNLLRFTDIYVSAHPIARGEALGIDSLKRVKRNISSLRSGYFINPDKLLGMIAKRSIRAGTALSPKYLRPPQVIKKGDKVKILAQAGGIEIRMSGKAMSAGAKGETIKVKNISSKRTVDAVVVASGAVEVMF